MLEVSLGTRFYVQRYLSITDWERTYMLCIVGKSLSIFMTLSMC